MTVKVLTITTLVTIAALAGAAFGINQLAAATAQNLVTQAASARDKNEINDALIAIDRASLLAPIAWQTKVDILTTRGEILAAAEDHTQAAASFQEAVALIEQSRFQSHHNLAPIARQAAQSLFASNQFTQTIDYLNKPGLPETPDDFLLLGRANLKLNNFEAASSALSQSATDEAAYYLLIALLETDLTEAKSQIESQTPAPEFKSQTETIAQALRNLSTDSSDLFKNITLAQTFNRIQEPELAEHHARLALEEDAAYRDAWLTLAESQLLQNNLAQAERSAKIAAEKDPTYKYTFDLLAKIKTAQGDLASAKTYSDQSAKLN